MAFLRRRRATSPHVRGGRRGRHDIGMAGKTWQQAHCKRRWRMAGRVRRQKQTLWRQTGRRKDMLIHCVPLTAACLLWLHSTLSLLPPPTTFLFALFIVSVPLQAPVLHCSLISIASYLALSDDGRTSLTSQSSFSVAPHVWPVPCHFVPLYVCVWRCCCICIVFCVCVLWPCACNRHSKHCLIWLAACPAILPIRDIYLSPYAISLSC